MDSICENQTQFWSTSMQFIPKSTIYQLLAMVLANYLGEKMKSKSYYGF